MNMLRFVTEIKSHYFGIIFSIITGIVFVLPNLLFINSTHYKGLPLMFTDAESFYLSKINSVQKGCFGDCNPYIKEYSNKFPFFDLSYSSLILSIPGIIFNISTVNLKIFYDFLLPCILFFLSYFLIYRLTSHKPLSILGGLFILLGNNLINIPDLINLNELYRLITLKNDYANYLIYSRPINPQFSSVFFVGYLHILLSTFKKPSSKNLIALTIFYGASFYIYFFTYVFISIINGLIIINFYLQKKYRYAFNFFLVTIAGLLIAIPVFIQIYRLLTHPLFSTIPHHILIYTNQPHISSWGITLSVTLLILSFIFIKKKIITRETYFVLILTLAGFVIRNQHIITGMIMQNDHFDMYYITPVFLISICYLSNVFFKNVNKKYYWILCLVPLVNGIHTQNTLYKTWYAHGISIQRNVPVLNWLKENTSNSIVAADQELSEIIPLYTSNYVLWSYYAGEYIHQPERKGIFLKRRRYDEWMNASEQFGVEFFVERTNADLLKSNDQLKIAYVDKYWVVYKK